MNLFMQNIQEDIIYMGIFLFVLGATFFLGLGALIVYWFIDLEPGDYFYRTISCEYIMALLVLLYFTFGSSVFGQTPQNWIVLLTSIIFSIFLTLYIYLYIGLDRFRIKLLLLLPLFGLELWQIWSSLIFIIPINVLVDVVLYAGVAIIANALVFIFFRRKKKKIMESELLHARYYRSNSDLPFEFYIRNSDLSGNVSDSINFLVMKLYQYARENRLSPSRLDFFLSHYEKILPTPVRERVVERFLESHYFNRMDSVNLVEFALMLFPEFFGGPSKTNSSDGYNLRLFEDFYILSQKNLDRNQAQLNELNQKLYQIESLLQGKTENNKQVVTAKNKVEIISSSEECNQSIIREIYHLTKTPLLTISAAARNMPNSSEHSLSQVQKEKLSTILDNVSTVKIILEAYRRLTTVSDISTNEDIVSYIKTAITSICDVCEKQVKQSISSFPEKVSAHGNNIIIILLIPLIHNAIEASPNMANISIQCVEKEDNYIITVENTCKTPPKQNDLERDGYSTKTDGGEGLRSVRRISKSIGIEFFIKVYSSKDKVVATLRVPKK